MINNEFGQRFRNSRYAIDAIGDTVDEFAAVKGYFECKLKSLLKHFVGDLGTDTDDETLAL